MDYEKKYKEALSKAKDMLSYKEVRCEDMVYLFPELKESEDERLRKTTIAFLKEYAEKGYENAVECIDWLEKQGKGGQSIVWNDEDEEKYSRLNHFIYSTSYCDSRKEFSDWLKSLKDRIQSKQGGQSFNIQWHDATEEPDEMREIFCEWGTNDAIRHAVVFYQADTKTFWDYELRIVNVVKWAYVDEILPKQN